jgi:hypothetical protein
MCDADDGEIFFGWTTARRGEEREVYLVMRLCFAISMSVDFSTVLEWT